MEISEVEKQRFWEKVDLVEDPTVCWEWKTGKDKKHYPRFQVNREVRLAHRVSFLIANGYLPADMVIMHKCDNVKCVNPNHLTIGTQKDNIQDMVKKGRMQNQKGERNNNTRLTWEIIKNIRATWKEGKLNKKEIALLFNISQTHVRGILNNTYWPEV